MIPLATRVAALERKLADLEARQQPGGYLSITDAAEYLGITKSTLKHYLYNLRLFTIIKVGRGQNGKALLKRDEIDRYLRTRAVPPVKIATLRAVRRA